MKIWIKYVLACILGSLAAFLLPLNVASVQKTIDFLTEMSIRFGRYMLVPLLFFSMVLAIYKLRNKENLFKTAVYVAMVSLITLCHFTKYYLVGVSAHLFKQPGWRAMAT